MIANSPQGSESKGLLRCSASSRTSWLNPSKSSFAVAYTRTSSFSYDSSQDVPMLTFRTSSTPHFSWRGRGCRGQAQCLKEWAMRLESKFFRTFTPALTTNATAKRPRERLDRFSLVPAEYRNKGCATVPYSFGSTRLWKKTRANMSTLMTFRWSCLLWSTTLSSQSKPSGLAAVSTAVLLARLVEKISLSAVFWEIMK